ncbi:MAG: transketolase [Desulfovibrionaceae bacterium]|nr:transketolase [Desulfovibrionaceae bacterium]
MPTRRQLANALRVLSMDAIEKAQSGHPGAPLGMADMAEALWRHGLKHNPANPGWVDRDRFVLSNGHASMLLYALLHLTGYDLPLSALEDFRQLGSKTPGHPEYGVTPGVDCTTGPLGQGIATAVGMALAERMLAQEFNREGHNIIDHRTYCFVGDGCLMEGVSQEACSLAGTWKLGRLIVFYDANGISIDGSVDAWFSEDTALRFRALGWQVIGPIDGHKTEELDAAIASARETVDKPSLIICRTHIGFGSAKVDSASSHGAPLGSETVAKARVALGWEEAPFVVPEEIRAAWDARALGYAAEEEWMRRFADYEAAYPKLAKEFLRRTKGQLPNNSEAIFAELCTSQAKETNPLATRKASKRALDFLVPHFPEMVGGSADLTGSVGTMASSQKPLDPTTYEGRYLYYGVREFGMSCIMNGLALHGGFLPYAGTFLSFFDQAKNAVRIGAMMGVHAVWVFTHDSIGVGEDGPTHQPIEQIASLRMIPGLDVWRPCDSFETAVAWQAALTRMGPTALVLSRQSVPQSTRTAETMDMVRRGGYILRETGGTPELILLATGSEVGLASAAFDELAAQGIAVRLVSLPSSQVFERESQEWRESVLPHSVRARLAIEAGSTDFWYRYVGLDGAVLGMTGFGLSGKATAVAEHFGFTVKHVVDLAREVLSRAPRSPK